MDAIPSPDQLASDGREQQRPDQPVVVSGDGAPAQRPTDQPGASLERAGCLGRFRTRSAGVVEKSGQQRIGVAAASGFDSPTDAELAYVHIEAPTFSHGRTRSAAPEAASGSLDRAFKAAIGLSSEPSDPADP